MFDKYSSPNVLDRYTRTPLSEFNDDALRVVIARMILAILQSLSSDALLEVLRYAHSVGQKSSLPHENAQLNTVESEFYELPSHPVTITVTSHRDFSVADWMTGEE